MVFQRVIISQRNCTSHLPWSSSLVSRNIFRHSWTAPLKRLRRPQQKLGQKTWTSEIAEGWLNLTTTVSWMTLFTEVVLRKSGLPESCGFWTIYGLDSEKKLLTSHHAHSLRSTINFETKNTRYVRVTE